MTTLLGKTNFLKLTTLEISCLSNLAISVTPTVNASNILIFFESFSDCLQSKSFDAKDIDVGSTCPGYTYAGVFCFRGTYIRGACAGVTNTESACNGSSYAMGACTEGVYIRGTCIAGPSARGLWVRNTCTCVNSAYIGTWDTYSMGTCIESACVNNVSIVKRSRMHLQFF